jgi:hypothetical protein
MAATVHDLIPGRASELAQFYACFAYAFSRGVSAQRFTAPGLLGPDRQNYRHVCGSHKG